MIYISLFIYDDVRGYSQWKVKVRTLWSLRLTFEQLLGFLQTWRPTSVFQWSISQWIRGLESPFFSLSGVYLCIILKCLIWFMLEYVDQSGFSCYIGSQADTLVWCRDLVLLWWGHKMQRNRNPVPLKSPLKRNPGCLKGTSFLNIQV